MATKQRRPLNDEELADAMRLRALLKQKKEDDLISSS